MRLRALLVAVVAGVLVPLVAHGQTGVFRSAYTTSGVAASGIAVGDFDKDGAADVAVCSTSQSTGGGAVTVLPGFNDGTFGVSDPILLQSAASAMVQGKFDGDSLDDLVVAQEVTDSVVFMQGLGNGSFFMPLGPPIDGGQGPVGLAKADLNGDGHLDVVVADSGLGGGAPGAVTFLIGDGQGNFVLQEQANPDVASEPDMPTVKSLPAGAGTVAVAVGNIDADPGLEVLVLNSSPGPGSGSAKTGTISIFTNNGCHGPVECANFRPYTPNGTLSAGNMPEDLALADLDGNGKLDLIVVNHNDDDVTVQLGNGDGTFGTVKAFPVGQSPLRLVIGDLNNDGHLDIVTSNGVPKGRDVSMLLGDGKGGFARARSFVATVQPQALALGDFNVDGFLDVVVAPDDSTTGSFDFATLLYRPDGSLHGVEDIPGNGPQSLAVADLDGDGVPDLLASVSDNQVAVFPSLRGGFADPITIPIGGRTLGVAAADLNGDVKPDIVVADQADNTVAVVLSKGGGQFAQPVAYTTAPKPDAVAVGDFNNDGRPDIAVSTTGTVPTCQGGTKEGSTCTSDRDCGPQGHCPSAPGVVSVLLQAADGSFSPRTDTPVDDNPISIAVADVNCDMKDDLLVANVASNTVSVLTSNGDGSFHLAQTVDTPQPVSLGVGDFDHDGVQDFAVLNYAGQTPPLNVFLFKGNCTGPFTPLPGWNHHLTDIARALVVRDFTGDQLADVAFAASTDNTVQLLAGTQNAAMRLSSLNSENVSIMPVAIAAGDFDLDGRYDAATANEGPNNISVLYNCARDISGVNGATVNCQVFPSKVCQSGTKMGSSCVRDDQCPSSTCGAAPLGSNALRGDANGDGERTAADLVAVAREVMDGDGFAVEDIGRGSYQASAGVDANGDGRVDAQDRLAVAHRIFGG